MSTPRYQVAVYRRLTILYPRSFRREYRDDLVDTFVSQLADESAVRVWGRTARDLATTVLSQPSQLFIRRSSRAGGLSPRG